MACGGLKYQVTQRDDRFGPKTLMRFDWSNSQISIGRRRIDGITSQVSIAWCGTESVKFILFLGYGKQSIHATAKQSNTVDCPRPPLAEIMENEYPSQTWWAEDGWFSSPVVEPWHGYRHSASQVAQELAVDRRRSSRAIMLRAKSIPAFLQQANTDGMRATMLLQVRTKYLHMVVWVLRFRGATWHLRAGGTDCCRTCSTSSYDYCAVKYWVYPA